MGPVEAFQKLGAGVKVAGSDINTRHIQRIKDEIILSAIAVIKS